MNNELTGKLSGVIELLLDASSRINEAKPKKYWYPLSMATYGTDEILEALDSLCSFRTTMWEKTALFEKKFAEYVGSRDGVMVNSGSSADLLLCFTLTNPKWGLVPRDSEVLIPVVTWPTQIWSAMMAGLKVRLVDVDPETLNINMEDMERKIGPETRAVFPVHIMGNPCDMDRITELAQEKNLVVIEDCCEAFGSEWDGVKVGNFGYGASFSFFFSHHITTMEGGMVTCRESGTGDHMRVLRAHGWARNVEGPVDCDTEYDIDPRYRFINWGFNLRPTELQAGFGLRQLLKAPEFAAHREQLAAKFFSFIDSCEFLSRPKVHRKARPSWFALPIVVKPEAPFSRKDLVVFLEEKGVETRPIVTGNLAKQPVREMFDVFREDDYPGADVIHHRGFYLGLSPFHEHYEMDRLLETLSEFFAGF